MVISRAHRRIPSRRVTRRLGLLTAGGLSVAGGLALGWGAVDPAIVRGVPTGGLVLIVAMVTLPVLMMGISGAARLVAAGTAETESELDHDALHDAGRHAALGAVGVVRHESHAGDRHERPHSPRTHRSRPVHRAADERAEM